jgi:hypothetical protein
MVGADGRTPLDPNVALMGRDRALARYLQHYPRCSSSVDQPKRQQQQQQQRRRLFLVADGTGRRDQRGSSQPSERPLPRGAATMDGTPRYMRMPLAPGRVMATYGAHGLARRVT